MNKSILKKTYLLSIAFAVAEKATCPDLKVGCVIATKDGHILSTGYNGVPHKHPHCREINGVCGENDAAHRVVHAEQNAVAAAARFGIAINGAIAYVTNRPCLKCKLLMIQAGIKKVVVARGRKKKYL